LCGPKKGVDRACETPSRKGSRVAYFAGCSAGYLFPAVAKAAVGLLEQNKIQVFVPSQHCCSMPLIMEGNRQAAQKRIQANLKTLGACIQDGYDIVCSCPTCGYFFKKLLKETAYYSDAFQHRANVRGNRMQVPTGIQGQKIHLRAHGHLQNLFKR
jgi:glycerol-3-phosphate dehydrogenase subunit C